MKPRTLPWLLSIIHIS